MAEKKQTTRMSADRLEKLKAGTTRAGKSKSTMAKRVEQNRGVKDGTIRIGKNGKSYNVYDAKTGTWKRGVVKEAGKSTAATKKSSGATGTYTKSYERGGATTGNQTGNLKKGELTLRDRLDISSQKSREKKRSGAAGVINKYYPEKRKPYGLTGKYSPKGVK